MKINSEKLKNNTLAIICLLPFFVCYFVLFLLSYTTANDRTNYLRIVSHPFEGRSEKGMDAIAWFLGGFINQNEIILLLIQFLFFFLLIYTFIKYLGSPNWVGSVKIFIITVLSFGVFSHQLGVQLRIGYASILFTYLFLGLQLKPNLKNLIFYLLPCFVHMGAIPAVLILYLFSLFKINNFKKFIFFVGIGFFIVINVLKIAPTLFVAVGFGGYYLDYLDSSIKLGRAIPFSVLFYVFLLCLIILQNKKNVNDIKLWFCFSGLLFLFSGFVLDLYISFKMLSVITMSTLIYFFGMIKIDKKSVIFIIAFMLLFSPIIFWYYAKQVGLII